MADETPTTTAVEDKPKRKRSKPSSPIQIYREIYLHPVELQDENGETVNAYVREDAANDENFMVLSIASEAQGSTLVEARGALRDVLQGAQEAGDEDTRGQLTGSPLHFMRDLEARTFGLEVRLVESRPSGNGSA